MGDLHREDADKNMAKTYALLIADTVMVPVEGESLPEKEKDRNLTVSGCPKGWTDAAYFFKVGTQQSYSAATECLPTGECSLLAPAPTQATSAVTHRLQRVQI